MESYIESRKKENLYPLTIENNESIIMTYSI